MARDIGPCIFSCELCSTGLTGSFLDSLSLMMYTRTNSQVSSNVNSNENIVVRKNVSVIAKSFEEEQDISIN